MRLLFAWTHDEICMCKRQLLLYNGTVMKQVYYYVYTLTSIRTVNINCQPIIKSQGGLLACVCHKHDGNL